MHLSPRLTRVSMPAQMRRSEAWPNAGYETDRSPCPAAAAPRASRVAVGPLSCRNCRGCRQAPQGTTDTVYLNSFELESHPHTLSQKVPRRTEMLDPASTVPMFRIAWNPSPSRNTFTTGRS